MTMKPLLTALMLALIPVLGVMAQARREARFHMELDYSYQLSVKDRLHGYGALETEGGYGHTLTLNALYTVSPDVTVGIGSGILRTYVKGGGNLYSLPAYATVRLHPWEAHRNLYGFADLGCSLIDGNSDGHFAGGMLGTVGVGYRLMLRRHFGFNVRLGYDVRQTRNSRVLLANETEEKNADGTPVYTLTEDRTSFWRQSLQLTVGLVF